MPDEALAAALDDDVAALWAAAGPMDYLRLDYRFDPATGKRVFLEFNICCHIGRSGAICLAAGEWGLSQADVLGHVVEYSLSRQAGLSGGASHGCCSAALPRSSSTSIRRGGRSATRAMPRGSSRGWDFLGSVPVPMRARVRDGVADEVTAHRRPAATGAACLFPDGAGRRRPDRAAAPVRDLDDFPRMLVSAEHGNAFNRRFHAQHVERNGSRELSARHRRAGIFRLRSDRRQGLDRRVRHRAVRAAGRSPAPQRPPGAAALGGPHRSDLSRPGGVRRLAPRGHAALVQLQQVLPARHGAHAWLGRPWRGWCATCRG